MRCVDGETLARTTMCPREFACLEGNGHCLCGAEGRVAKGVVVTRLAREGCPYAAPGAGSDLCTCPTRAELLEKYGV